MARSDQFDASKRQILGMFFPGLLEDGKTGLTVPAHAASHPVASAQQLSAVSAEPQMPHETYSPDLDQMANNPGADVIDMLPKGVVPYMGKEFNPKMTRGQFLKAAGLVVAAMGLPGVLSGCAGKDYNTWVRENRIVMPGQPGFLSEANLGKIMSRYYSQAAMAKELLHKTELDMDLYDKLVSAQPGLQIVGFLHPQTQNAQRQLLSLAHVSETTQTPLHLVFTTYGSGNYGKVNDLLDREIKSMTVDNYFRTLVVGGSSSSPRDIFPVTLFVKDGKSVDLCWYEIHTIPGVQQNAAILEYAIGQMKKPGYKPMLKGRTVQEINKAPEFKQVREKYR